jgi:hypothetical protein
MFCIAELHSVPLFHLNKKMAMTMMSTVQPLSTPFTVNLKRKLILFQGVVTISIGCLLTEKEIYAGEHRSQMSSNSASY